MQYTCAVHIQIADKWDTQLNLKHMFISRSRQEHLQNGFHNEGVFDTTIFMFCNMCKTCMNILPKSRLQQIFSFLKVRSLGYTHA